MEAQAHPTCAWRFTLALSHNLNLASANTRQVHTSIQTHTLATLHATIASNQCRLLLKQEIAKRCLNRSKKESYSLQEKEWIHKSEAIEKEGTQEHRRLKSSPLKTKHKAKMWETLIVAPFYRRGLIPIHTMGDRTLKPSRVSKIQLWSSFGAQ